MNMQSNFLLDWLAHRRARQCTAACYGKPASTPTTAPALSSAQLSALTAWSILGALLFFMPVASSEPSSVYSDIYGVIRTDLPAGGHLISAPLLGQRAYQGPVLEVGGSAGDVVSLENVPALERPHYLIVIGEATAAAGQYRTILASDDTSVTLESAITGLSTGDTIQIVEYFTLDGFTRASGGSLSNGTSLTVYESDGSTAVYRYYGIWYDADFQEVSDVILFPGEGAVLNLTTGVTLDFTGTVNGNEIKINIYSGVVNLVGSGNPTAPVGDSSLGAALSHLPDGSTLAVYSGDGTLTAGEVYRLYGGNWYDNNFQVSEISIAAPACVVVNPTLDAEVTLSAAHN